MKNKAHAVQAALQVTENWAKRCQISGRSTPSYSQIRRENRTLGRDNVVAAQGRQAPVAEKRLVSWKEIAGYLHCTIRSVQRWEHNEGLPVHRHLHQRGSTAYAYAGELDSWLETRISLEASCDRSAGLPTTRARLCVLPFVHLGEEPQLNLACDGLTEELIFQLARLDPKRLGIIARTTSMSQKPASNTIAEIGGSLGVSWVVEGCLRCSGSHLRITAQLIRVSDQTQVWTECFEGEGSDLLNFQSESARHLADSLHRSGLLLDVSLPRVFAPILSSRSMEHSRTRETKTSASQDKHRKQNQAGSTGARDQRVGKAPLLHFVTLAPPKEFCTQEPGRSVPC